MGVLARSYAKYGEVPLGPVPGDDNARAWYNSTTKPGWIWKGDTSSDEIVGHAFVQSALATVVLPLDAFDGAKKQQQQQQQQERRGKGGGIGSIGMLRGGGRRDRGRGSSSSSSSSSGGGPESSGQTTSMTEALAEALAPMRADATALLAATMDGIIDANYTLIDPGLGTPTTWGRWDAHDLNEVRGYSDERGLNSAQIIAWLRSAAALSGADDGARHDFGAEADALKADHGYGLNAVNAKITTPGDVNFSDDELLLLPSTRTRCSPAAVPVRRFLKDPEMPAASRAPGSRASPPSGARSGPPWHAPRRSKSGGAPGVSRQGGGLGRGGGGGGGGGGAGVGGVRGRDGAGLPVGLRRGGGRWCTSTSDGPGVGPRGGRVGGP